MGHLPAVIEARNAHLQGRVPIYDVETRMRLSDGRWAWVHTRGRCIVSEDGSLKMLGLTTPLPTRHTTEHRLTSQSRSLSQLLSDTRASCARRTEFVAAVAREIRGPLKRAVGLCERVERGEVAVLGEGGEKSMGEGVVREVVREVKEEVEGVEGVVEDMLDISLLTLQTLTLHPTLFHLPTLIHTSISPYQHKAAHKSIQLITEIADGTPEWVVGDSGRCGQVLRGVVGNAVRGTERGRVVVGVRKGAREGRVLFSVADTGVGMEEGEVRGLFWGANGGEKDGVGGRKAVERLSLSVCDKLVKLMGGEIRVRSLVGIGSVFEFEVGVGVGKAGREVGVGVGGEVEGKVGGRERSVSRERRKSRERGGRPGLKQRHSTNAVNVGVGGTGMGREMKRRSLSPGAMLVEHPLHQYSSSGWGGGALTQHQHHHQPSHTQPQSTSQTKHPSFSRTNFDVDTGAPKRTRTPPPGLGGGGRRGRQAVGLPPGMRGAVLVRRKTDDGCCGARATAGAVGSGVAMAAE
ncbi:hypothetical protein HDV00_004590 [Rhizophlyctis rosea]|nr:hypothetical protein HDV00_004590 [Rhizophlyctis rosea]